MDAMFLPLSYRFSHAFSASLKRGLPRATTANVASVSRSDEWFEETKGRISKVFDHKNESISISTYDTAWVAMVPSPFSPEEPCFPDTLFWLLENQCHDGSWARPHHHSRLKKDVLSSTLACIIALKKWGVGQQHINRGLDFLELNFASTKDESQIRPIGFDIIFPAMLDHAKGLSLNLNLDITTLNDMMNIRDLELKRCYESESRGTESYLAYIGEGMGELQDWESVVMKYQRKNGSLFNSPSTTAAAFMALGNSNCLKYLNLLVNKFGSAVPAVYPLNIYSQLCTVDNLERLGINRHFIMEIQSVLDQTYRCWVEGDEEIFMDAATCALAFRILRMNGYNVTSDAITKVIEEWFSISSGNKRDINTTLALYKASQFTLYPHEKELEKQTPKLRSLLLEQQLSSWQSPQENAEVKQALDYPFYAIMDRMAKRNAIKHYNFDSTRILKTSYCSPKFGNKDFLLLSVEDYNKCQAIHLEEAIEFDRWFVESRLDEVEYANHKSKYCYWTAAATVFSPEQSDVRMSWAKHGVIVTVLDDLFDVRGSVQEMTNLIRLLQEWKANEISTSISECCCSRNVEIIFSAVKSTICESVEKGSKLQGRSIRSHVISIYLDMLHCFMKEVEWRESKYVPSFDEYMSNGYVSAALGPVTLIPLYLIGPKLSEQMINHSHSHYQTLYKLIGTIIRLLNDIRCDEREVVQGKPISALPLYMAEKKSSGEMISKEAAISEITAMIERQTRELVRLVVEDEDEDGVVPLPKACRGFFLHMCTVVHLFYKKDDGFWSKELIQILSQIVHQPILLEDIIVHR